MAIHVRNAPIFAPGTARWRCVLGLTAVCLVPVIVGCGVTVGRDLGVTQRDGSSNVVCGLAASAGGHSLVCSRGRTLTISP